MSVAKGYRGYIGSRPYSGSRTPQHVQNLVIRDYCQRNGLAYLLSATEYAMDDSYIMLEEVLSALPQLNGVVLYSIAMLPPDRQQRHGIYNRILQAGASLHGAIEGMVLGRAEDIGAWEDVLLINALLERK